MESWLKHHGEKLKNRFERASYKLMNHLLKTIGNHLSEKDFETFLQKTNTKIHIISVDSDYMFTEKEQCETYQFIKNQYEKARYNTIKSIHGHDAFLIEFNQLHTILNRYF